MFVDFRCPIRVECILSCSTTSAFCPANPARGYILAEFCYSLTDFGANLSSLIKASLFWELYGIILAGDIYGSREGTSDFRLQTSDFRLQTSDFRLQTSDFRLQTSDFKHWFRASLIANIASAKLANI